jgi:hypothetical protein
VSTSFHSKTNAYAASPQRKPTDEGLQDKMRTTQVAERKQQAGQRAAFAGGTRVRNDADLLGLSPGVARRQSSRVLLGE